MFENRAFVRDTEKTIRFNQVTDAYLEKIISVTGEQKSTLIHRLMVEAALRELTIGMNVNPKEIANEVLKKSA